jgi:predicted nucleic acid-binding protein
VIERLPRAVVPDASVILKWVLHAENEPGTREAWELLDRSFEEDLRLFVPQLWTFEVGNVLSRKRPTEAADLLLGLRMLRMIETRLEAQSIERTVELTCSYGISFYDASYLAIAEQHKALLVTADGRFRRRLPDDFPILLIGETA